jgi:hypothetical protein
MFNVILHQLRINQNIINIDYHNSSNLSWKIEFMKVVKVEGAWHRPNGMTKNLQMSYLILMVIFSTFAYAMWIWQ